MKEVMAVIRMNAMSATKAALAEFGVGSFTATKVLGRGKGQVDYRLLRGAEEGFEEAIQQLGQAPRLIPKRLLTVVVPDEKVALVVETIVKTNCTSRPGDGKIFVMPVTNALRVRTGEDGEEAIYEGSR
jgi:nitrogen regulatory protein PII 2